MFTASACRFVSVDSGNEVPRDIFEAASKAVFTLMEKDSYVRFKRTDLWLKYRDAYQNLTSFSASTLTVPVAHRRRPSVSSNGGRRHSGSALEANV